MVSMYTIESSWKSIANIGVTIARYKPVSSKNQVAEPTIFMSVRMSFDMD